MGFSLKDFLLRQVTQHLNAYEAKAMEDSMDMRTLFDKAETEIMKHIRLAAPDDTCPQSRAYRFLSKGSFYKSLATLPPELLYGLQVQHLNHSSDLMPNATLKVSLPAMGKEFHQHLRHTVENFQTFKKAASDAAITRLGLHQLEHGIQQALETHRTANAVHIPAIVEKAPVVLPVKSPVAVPQPVVVPVRVNNPLHPF
jgi:hypothetical protein